MARRSLSQNLPSLVKGGCTVGAVTYQSAAARTYHDEDEDAAVGGGVDRESTVLTGGSTGNTTSGRPEEVAVHRGALKVVEQASPSSSSSPDRQISVKEVEEASRILFAPEGSAHRQHHHHHRRAAASSSFREANNFLSARGGRGRGGGGGGGGGGGQGEAAASVEEDLASNDEGAISPLTSPMFRARPNSSSSSSSSSSAVAAAAAAATAAAATTSSSSASAFGATLTRLHPQPEVHAEILRFGMALASNPKIQSAIREELKMHHVQQQQQLEGGREGGREEGLEAAEATVAQMESTVRRLLRREVAGGEEEEEEEEEEGGRNGGRGSPGSRSSSSSFLTGSFELLGVMSAEWAQAHAEEEDEEEKEEGKYDGVAENLPSNSFVSVGRNMRRKDVLTGEVSEEVLDELLRGDDDDDVITQNLFAQTPDEQVRRYLRNLDLECVICCEYMVECKAVDCGEGHTFCGECIERWLGREGGHGGGGGRRCPTCQKPCGATIPMRSLDAMIEKYVRASNLWDEQCSFYRRRTLAHMRRELERQDREEEEAAAAAAAAATAGSQNPFVGFGNLLFGLGGPGGAAATRRRRRNRQAAADAAAAAAAAAGGGASARGEGGAEDAAQPWWKSEVLSTALSVATMLVLLVLFKRGIKIR